MLVLGLAVVISMLIPLLTGGSYARLVMAGWRLPALLFAGLGIQLGLEYVPIPESRWHDVGFGLLVASYVLVLGFCAANLLLRRGMAVVMIGVACNAIVIVANQGMPVEIPPDWQDEAWIEPTIKHHPADGDERLMFLADIIVLRDPYNIVISFGDLILAVGLCDVTYWASRRSRRRVEVGASPEPASPEPVPSDPAKRRGSNRTLDLDPYVGGSPKSVGSRTA